MAYDYQDGFTHGGAHSSSFNLIVIEKDVPPMPEVEEQAEEMAGLDGGYDFGIRYKPKIIPVTVRLLNAVSKADYNNKLRSLASSLNPRKGSKPLIFDDEPDKQYFARLSQTFNPQRMGMISKDFTLTFICYDPFTYSIAEKDLSGTSSILCNNAGSHLAEPILYITKGAGALTVRNTHPDQTTEDIVFNASSPAGVYVIDSKEKTSLLDSEGAYEYLDEETYFTFQEGDNTLSIVSGSVTNMRAVYRDTWL